MTELPSVASGPRLEFGDFRMDLARYRLWRGQREISLRPKSWDVLHILLTRPGLLLAKQAFQKEMTGKNVVSAGDTLSL